jgi:hypothetical protein
MQFWRREGIALISSRVLWMSPEFASIKRGRKERFARFNDSVIDVRVAAVHR